PVFFKSPARPGKLQENCAQKLEVIVELKLTKIGNLADLPQELDVLARPTAGRDLGIFRQAQERPRVVSVGDQLQARVRRPPRQGPGQACERIKVEIAVTPEDLGLNGKTVILDGANGGRGQLGQGRQGDELSVVVVAAGATGDLRQLGVFQIA